MAEKRFYSGSPSGLTPERKSLRRFNPSPGTTNLISFVEGLSLGPDESGIEEAYGLGIPRGISPIPKNRNTTTLSPIIGGNINRILRDSNLEISRLNESAIIDDTNSYDESFGMLEEFGVGIDPGVWVSPRKNVNNTPKRSPPKFGLFTPNTPESGKKVRFEDDFPPLSPPKKPISDYDFPPLSPPIKNVNISPISPPEIEKEFEQETYDVLNQTRKYVPPTKNMAYSLTGIKPKLAIDKIAEDIRKIRSSMPSPNPSNLSPSRGRVKVQDFGTGELVVSVERDENENEEWFQYDLYK